MDGDSNDDVVKNGIPTSCQRGTLFVMELGKRIVLGKYDRWEPNDEEPFWDQLARVSLSPEEIERREQAALRFQLSGEVLLEKKRARRVPGEEARAREPSESRERGSTERLFCGTQDVNIARNKIRRTGSSLSTRGALSR